MSNYERGSIRQTLQATADGETMDWRVALGSRCSEVIYGSIARPLGRLCHAAALRAVEKNGFELIQGPYASPPVDGDIPSWTRNWVFSVADRLVIDKECAAVIAVI